MSLLKSSIFSIVCISVLTTCGSEKEKPPIKPLGPFAFEQGLTFEWRLDDLPDDFSTEADVIDIDAFSATPELVANLKAQGKKVVAYVSVGSFEDFRPDSGVFPILVLGNRNESFESELWLDIREIDQLAPILTARFDMIRDKGFDGIEPDNINGYKIDTGFPLTEEDAAIFSRWLINEAHSRGLSIGQKNAPELVPEMVDEFDWILVEDAFVKNFADQLSPYSGVGKAVFLTEYTDRISVSDFQSNVCPLAKANGFSAVLKNRDLTNTTVYCN
ncbi:endo alpha-1,4 polygalactosaminidase [Fulvivirga sp. M361]|uniref:endo alpha-1,4 polygalactosaminidase n=1 Tax=Fulvivirga sp. M361 TaxID=2594266 RepID=UPI00117B2FCF|nr:endo alpha-1,4 polygalactosaminidase [Fulvivirga sp. M361]TRX49330.1 endo alpha-1,4 polygalactosaminidase [Fulvivirga sp. M361]